MEVFNIIFFLVFSMVAVSYGWGMRGTIIGGEKGAMLPGAFMGMLIAVFSGSEVLASSPWILAGIGALGMYCGGNMTYGETLHLSMHEKNPPHLKKGLFALFIKGGIWFGLFGGFVALFISALAGYYELWQVLVFFGALPIFALAFFFIFNKPLNPDENKFPKIYFSIKRQETWGGLFGILLEIIIFSIIMKDWSALVMTGGTFISGAVGWVIAQLMQIRAKHPGKNGKRLFEKLNQKKAVDAWKIMECVLGAIGGLGCAVTFLLTKPLFKEKISAIDVNGFHSYISESKITYFMFILYCVILFADAFQYFIIPKDTNGYRKYMKFCEHSEFAVYCVIPMMFCMLGSHLVAATVALPVITLVLCQEFAEKSNKIGKSNLWQKSCFFLFVIIEFMSIAFNKDGVNIIITVLMYTLLYEIAFFLMRRLEHGNFKISNSEKTVHGYFFVCCVLIILMTIFI